VSQYRIHPIVMGTKQFDKGMMTYQQDYGKPYTIPIYCWYLEGGDRSILVDTGEMHPLQSDDRAGLSADRSTLSKRDWPYMA
jgi:N-acyl homoserine lactone hydrolase